MARLVSMLIGLVLLGLGVWAIAGWWEAVLNLLRACVAIAAVLLGIGVLVFGLSETWTGRPGDVAPPSGTALPEGPGEPA